MTSRERSLAALRHEAVDRLPFWPKLDAAYTRAQAAPFSEMSLAELHEWIGSDQHVLLGPCFRMRRPRTALDVETRDGVRRTSYRTPHGTLSATHRWDEASQSWHPTEFPVKCREDVELMTAWYGDARVDLDRDALARVREDASRIGQTALIVVWIGVSPLMYFVEWLAGVEQAHLLLADEPEVVEGLFAEMHRVLLRVSEITVAEHPADLFYMGENTSTTLISPSQFRRYCVPHLTEYAERAREADRLLGLHMCGHLKAILPDLARLPVAAFEAFTSPPVGNTTLLDGRSACPNVCLIGGTNATLWTRPPQEIIERIEADLAVLPHHRGLVITSGGVMPPCCPPETIREVAAWLKAYRATA